MGTQALPQKGGGAPQIFRPIFRPIVAKRLDGSRWHLAWRWAFGPHYIVLDGDPAPLPKRGAEPPPIFGPFYCGQMAGCIKMPLCMDVGLSLGDFVLGGDPVPSPQKGAVPLFGPRLL